MIVATTISPRRAPGPGALVEAALERVSSALVSRPERALLLDAIAGLEFEPTGYFVECRLGRPSTERRADLLVVNRGAVALRSAARPGAWGRGAAGHRLAGAHARALAQPELAAQLVLVEFDASERGGAWAGVHACVDPAFATHGWRPAPAPQRLGERGLERLLREVFELAPGRVHAALAELRRCRRALPAEGRLLHLSCMYGRPGSPLKLNLVLPGHALSSFLDAVGWPGDRGGLAELARRFRAATGWVKLDLGVGPRGVGPGLGFEVGEPSFALDEDPVAAFAGFVIELEREGLCTRDQADALLAWRGPIELELPGYGWPAQLRRSVEIKLVLDGPRIRAKAYLSFEPSFSLFRSPAQARGRGPAALGRALDRLVAEGHVHADAPRRLESTCARLPEDFCDACVELRLDDHTELDVLVCGRREHELARFRAACRHASPPVAATIDAWIGGSLRWAEVVWLVYEQRDGATAEGVYLGLRERGELARARISTAARLGGLTWSSAAEAELADLLAHLPAGGIVNHVGIKSTDSLRLALDVPADHGELGSWLAELGDDGELATVIAEFCPPRLGVTLDLPRAGGRPELQGLELVAEGRERGRWAGWLAALRDRGVGGERLELLRTWPGPAESGWVHDLRHLKLVRCAPEPGRGQGSRLRWKVHLWLSPSPTPDDEQPC